MGAITCTPGGSDDNCYVTEAQADGYFAEGLRTGVWEGWSGSDRQGALIQATAQIESTGGARASEHSPARVLFHGSPYATHEYDAETQKYVPAQALHFPRKQDVDPNGEPVIPQSIREAVCEQAYWLMERRDNPGLVDRERLQAEGVRRVSADGLSEEYGGRWRPDGIAPEAWRRVRPYLRSAFRTVE